MAAGEDRDKRGTGRDQPGKTSKGFKLPNGTVFRDRGKLIKFLRANPGYVWKNRLYLKSQLGGDLELAGYNVTPRGDRMQQYEYQAGKGKLVKAWEHDPGAAEAFKARNNAEGTKVVRVKPPTGARYVNPRTAKAKAKPPTKAAPVTDYSRTSTQPGNPAVRGTAGGATAAAAGATGKSKNAGPTLFDMAIKRLLGLNARAGFQPINADDILAGLDVDQQSQLTQLQASLDALKREGEGNVAKIGDMFKQVGGSVDTARQRGMQMTQELGGNLAGNNAAILASIGGEAAMGAAPAAQVAQSGQNTLAAFGAADAQFLNDMGPLLQGEGAGLQAEEMRRISELSRDFQQQMSSIKTGDNSKRAELALQIAQMNNEGRQQGFSNSAGLAETLAGLALSGEKISASQQQAIAAMLQRQADQDRRYYEGESDDAARVDAQNTAQINRANASASRRIVSAGNAARQLGNLEGLTQAFPNLPPGKGNLAPSRLVEQVLNIYRSHDLDLRDPRVKKAAAASIATLGYRVDPKWVKGWA